MSRSALPDVTVLCSVRRYTINERKVIHIVRTIGQSCGLSSFQLGVSFVGSTRMRQLNRQFRKKDKSTDVLSFPMSDWKKPIRVIGKTQVIKKPNTVSHADPLGDIVISLDDAGRNALSIGQPLSREVCFLLIHGFLHLCGHDHMRAKEEQVMLAAQRKIFKRMETGQIPMWTKLVIKNRSHSEL